MLSSIANLLGYTEDMDDVTHSRDASPNDLKTRKGDDGWVLVDRRISRADRERLESSCLEDPCVARMFACEEARARLRADSRAGSDSDVTESVTLPDYVLPQESWLVTPPPCFTASGSAAASPLENLLIEHPSMSVYARGSHDDSAAAVARPAPKPARVLRRGPRRAHAVAQRAGLDVARGAGSRTQRPARTLGRAQLKRANLCAHVTARSGPLRRSQRQATQAGRNNDRKCH